FRAEESLARGQTPSCLAVGSQCLDGTLVHPKTVQSVMRHSTITLTMDTYGHLFPGQEAEAVSRFPVMV
ncbi:MAG: hypothetical protein JXB62_08870, partial [Pirellulales bacterium]|nr:hypothetical protein [Pirellulales bacterium]